MPPQRSSPARAFCPADVAASGPLPQLRLHHGEAQKSTAAVEFPEARKQLRRFALLLHCSHHEHLSCRQLSRNARHQGRRACKPRHTRLQARLGSVAGATTAPDYPCLIEAATILTAMLQSFVTAIGQERPRGDQDVSAQIAQPSDALGATAPLAQRTLPRSASKHPDCRSRARADATHADHIAAELEPHQPPPGRGRDCWFVAHGAVGSRVPLRAAVDRKQKCGLAGAERVRWLGLRGCSSLVPPHQSAQIVATQATSSTPPPVGEQ